MQIIFIIDCVGSLGDVLVEIFVGTILEYSVGLFTVYFKFLQKYLYNKYSVVYIYIYIYMVINIKHIYIYISLGIQNCDNVTMYYYIHFTTLYM